MATAPCVRTSSAQAAGPGAALDGLGLRERKKRDLRQRLSDTATAMFLARGFQQVRVSEIAAACSVSEKTVFNYFPTKESLLFDRGDAMAEALSQSFESSQAVLGAVLASLEADLDRLDETANGAEARTAVELVRRFGALVEATPSLRAAMAEMLDRLTRLAADALARAQSSRPEAPEIQIRATALVGLWRVQHNAMRRHASVRNTPSQVRKAVLTELMQAAAVVERTL